VEHKQLIVLIAIALAGMFFLTKGFTGLVVSQTCCFPPDCSPENLCDNAKEIGTGEYISVYLALGGLLFLISIIPLILFLRTKV
jgi:hypothetical protein